MVMTMLFLEILVCLNVINACQHLFYQYSPPEIIYHGVLGANMCGSIYRCLCESFNGTEYLAAYYDTDHKVPIFSAYRIDTFEKQKEKLSSRKWRTSIQLRPGEQPLIKDYNGVGRDHLNRGHLAPRFYFPTNEGRAAADVLTNIALQYKVFNQRTWHTLEKSTFAASRDHCQYYGGQSYFITGTVPSRFGFFKVKNSTKKINIPDYFWTAVCCDTSGVSYANRNNVFKGWSFAYIVKNVKSGQGIFDIMTVEAFLKHPEFRSRYKHFSLFREFQGYGRKVKNCLFDSDKADELMKSIRQDYTITLRRVEKKQNPLLALLAYIARAYPLNRMISMQHGPGIYNKLRRNK